MQISSRCVERQVLAIHSRKPICLTHNRNNLRASWYAKIVCYWQGRLSPSGRMAFQSIRRTNFCFFLWSVCISYWCRCFIDYVNEILARFWWHSSERNEIHFLVLNRNVIHLWYTTGIVFVAFCSENRRPADDSWRHDENTQNLFGKLIKLCPMYSFQLLVV